MTQAEFAPAIAALKTKLEEHEAAAEACRTAIAALESLSPPATRRSGKALKLLLPPEPKAKGVRTKRAEPTPREGLRDFDVGKATVSLTAKEADAMDLFIAAPEGVCVTTDTLENIWGSRASMHAGLREMRDKLNAAGATIGNVRGEGYRLETL